MQKIEVEIQKKNCISLLCSTLFFVKRVKGEPGETPRRLVGELGEVVARKKNAR